MLEFLRLVRKDLEGSRWPIGIVAGIVIGYFILVRIKFPPLDFVGWQEALFIIAVPFLFLPFWLLWQSFQTLRVEWRENTVYTLLILPIPGWKILLAKIAEICLQYTIFIIVALGGGLITFHQYLTGLTQLYPSTAWAVRNGLLLYFVGLAALIFVVVLVQLAFIVGKMVGRVQGIISLWTLFLASWLVGKVSQILEPVFRWLPPLPIHKLFRLNQVQEGIILEWDMADQIGGWLAVVALFFLAGYLLEHFVEIND